MYYKMEHTATLMLVLLGVTLQQNCGQISEGFEAHSK